MSAGKAGSESVARHDLEDRAGFYGFKLVRVEIAIHLVHLVVELVDGVSIWRGQDGKGWIVASAQAADRYVVYERQAPHAVMGVFTLVANTQAGIDKVTHTDGLDVFSGALPGYPRGILVVQDDGNPNPEQDQNFKLVDWAMLEAALGLPVLEAE